MNEIVRPGSAVLYMKIGTHANEGLDGIIERKSKEIKDTGFAMWGYGGNTCHPTSMVQPFAKLFADQGRPIHLVMEAMNSNHFAEPLAASEYSVDNRSWKKIPDSINVLGSRYALLIEDLTPAEFELPLDQTRVPVGPSMGRVGSKYIAGRVDKACLEVLDRPLLLNDQQPVIKNISLTARLREPYAVFLRNYRT